MFVRRSKEKSTRHMTILFGLSLISYPFSIPTDQKLDLDEEMYGILISINNEWFIKEFTLDEETNK